MSTIFHLPLTDTEKQLEHHAFLCATGFLILLPIGALLARYLRTFTRRWVWGHAAIQFIISGPVIIAGWVMGFKFTALGTTGGHFIDPHKRIGLILLILYLVEVLGGLFIKFVKIGPLNRRPPQNYAHAILGLGMIALAGYQAWYGLHTEWAFATGNIHPVPRAALLAWMALIIIFWALYAIGMSLLPRQFRQERGTQTMSRSSEKMALRENARSLSGIGVGQDPSA